MRGLACAARHAPPVRPVGRTGLASGSTDVSRKNVPRPVVVPSLFAGYVITRRRQGCRRGALLPTRDRPRRSTRRRRSWRGGRNTSLWLSGHYGRKTQTLSRCQAKKSPEEKRGPQEQHHLCRLAGAATQRCVLRATLWIARLDHNSRRSDQGHERPGQYAGIPAAHATDPPSWRPRRSRAQYPSAIGDRTPRSPLLAKPNAGERAYVPDSIGVLRCPNGRYRGCRGLPRGRRATRSGR